MYHCHLTGSSLLWRISLEGVACSDQALVHSSFLCLPFYYVLFLYPSFVSRFFFLFIPRCPCCSYCRLHLFFTQTVVLHTAFLSLSNIYFACFQPWIVLLVSRSSVAPCALLLLHRPPRQLISCRASFCIFANTELRWR